MAYVWLHYCRLLRVDSKNSFDGARDGCITLDTTQTVIGVYEGFMQIPTIPNY
jgi:hypothetical protein